MTATTRAEAREIFDNCCKGDTTQAFYLNYMNTPFLEFEFLNVQGVMYDKGSDFTKRGFLATSEEGFTLDNSKDKIFQKRVRYSEVVFFRISDEEEYK